MVRVGDYHSHQMFSLGTSGDRSRLMLLFPPSFVLHGQTCPLLIGGHSMELINSIRLEVVRLWRLLRFSDGDAGK